MNSWKAKRPPAWELQIVRYAFILVSGLNLPSVKDVHEWDRENIWLLGTSKVGNMGVEWNTLRALALSKAIGGCKYLLSSGSLCNSERDTENGISTELSLVWGSVKTVQELVNLWLILNINVLLDESWTDDIIHVGNSLGDSLSIPLALITISELDSLVLTWLYLYQLPISSFGAYMYVPVEAPDGTMARWRPVSVTMSTCKRRISMCAPV